MHLTTILFSVLTALTFTLNSAFAANICTYTSRGCGGSYGCCNNISAGQCCSWGNSYGWSVRMSSMSGSWWAGCYATQSCTNQMAVITVGGSTVCKFDPLLLDS